ncbi:RNA polymerase, sigma-24 subunit, ECF subfamily [Ammonifex degensii KC4]|uniref:RNA polymerase sigma factor n=1 Tax=Ammonifex degensii (strain DSM 10501 / KC4) TaxID=429009 RepID=C9RAI8_AMMDK|nr:sigma-70 family RNA polymerase sigma factor [Ammonifex degensii]ACX51265.1 RNA polymerase, sigma-24 subunit, ECF subfamily [Ammonifex degensii KC4]
MAETRHLLEQARAGSHQAFEELVLAYQDRVYGLCYRLTGNHDDAEDLAQEVFVRAYRGLRSFRAEADFGTYLHRIAVNLFLNHRRKANHNTLSLDDPVSVPDGELPRQVADGNHLHPEEEAEKREFIRLVRRALNSLSREHRAVLVLREMEEMSYEEIAAVLGVAPGTVKSRLNRARAALQKALIKMAREAGLELLPGEGKVDVLPRGKEVNLGE